MILKQIFDVLKTDNTDVYFPTQHKGECNKEYIVVKADGVTQEIAVSSERPIYTVMCYVPVNEYTRLETFVFETKLKMKKLFPMLMYLGNETPSFYDDVSKAHMISFQYQGCRKLTNW